MPLPTVATPSIQCSSCDHFGQETEPVIWTTPRLGLGMTVSRVYRKSDHPQDVLVLSMALLCCTGTTKVRDVRDASDKSVTEQILEASDYPEVEVQ